LYLTEVRLKLREDEWVQRGEGCFVFEEIQIIGEF
jgi:hypothetical protein